MFNYEDEQLKPARGIFNGMLLGLLFWAVIVTAYFIFVWY
jgi:hypothetical protein